jgi:DNA primase
MSSHVEKIKERLTITDVVGSYIKMEKAGANYKARCPFHHEKTPSFFISPARNSYYCFGCGVKGDIFTFVQEFEGVDFMGSLRVLAQRAGVELVKEDPKERSERGRHFLCLEFATIFFQKHLLENPANSRAIDYLVNRGLTKETIRDWKIGFAPDDWRSLLTFLKLKKFTEADMEKVGLIKKKDGTDGGAPQDYYDRFRKRIMFPIFDSSGRVIGFSGRIFEGDEKSAKYLNSPETDLFKKSEVLFGINKAKNALRERDSAILVEGQMDLIMSHQSGFANTLASSGTALTEQHLAYIRRFTNNVVMAFDPDSAGVNAALRGAKIALALGLDVKVAVLPPGKDPADCIKENPSAWSQAVEKSSPVIDFLVDAIIKRNPDDKKRFLEVRTLVLPLIAGISGAMEKSHYVNKLVKILGVKEESVWDDIKKVPTSDIISKEYRPDETAPLSDVHNQYQHQKKNIVLEKLFGVMFWLEAGGKDGVEALKKKLADVLSKEEYDASMAFFAQAKEELILEADIVYGQSKRLGEDLRELMANLQKDRLKDALSKALTRLARAEQGKDGESAQAILEECKQISDKIAKLNQT